MISTRSITPLGAVVVFCLTACATLNRAPSASEAVSWAMDYRNPLGISSECQRPLETVDSLFATMDMRPRRVEPNHVVTAYRKGPPLNAPSGQDFLARMAAAVSAKPLATDSVRYEVWLEDPESPSPNYAADVGFSLEGTLHGVRFHTHTNESALGQAWRDSFASNRAGVDPRDFITAYKGDLQLVLVHLLQRCGPAMASR